VREAAIISGSAAAKELPENGSVNETKSAVARKK